VLPHGRIAGFACPLEAFFGQFPIVSGRRHRFPQPGAIAAIKYITPLAALVRRVKREADEDWSR
jgi:hypothetical protein